MSLQRQISERYPGWNVNDTGGHVELAFKDFEVNTGATACVVVGEVACIYWISEDTDTRRFLTYDDYCNGNNTMFLYPGFIIEDGGRGDSAGLFTPEQVDEITEVWKIMQD
jgi:hypothetical protein